ncbi:MAG: phosphoribosylglycinamide formyltransferase, partial [Clostridium celatum]|nr:phosphoribosylglycinamide formyltransferase [Clostridium celatum]
MLKVAVLVSGGGSNLQSILDYGQDTFKVEMVIGSKE